MTTVLTKQQIIDILRTNDRAVGRALVRLYHRQTEAERSAANTQEHNGRGFNTCHAYLGTRIAKNFLDRGFLTDKELEWARRPQKSGIPRIGIYARQLLEEANARAARKQPELPGIEPPRLIAPRPY